MEDLQMPLIGLLLRQKALELIGLGIIAAYRE